MGEETFNAMPDPPLAGQLNMNELQQLFELAPFGIGVFDRHFRCRSVNQTPPISTASPEKSTTADTCGKSSPRWLRCWNPCSSRSSAAASPGSS